ncbi:MAG: DUF1045 domain-containing protein [Pseudomonadota bacterium]
MTHSRFAIYYLPPMTEDWGQWGAAWLGWDVEEGVPAAHPQLDGLPLPVSEITATPRKYGLHATLKPPFRLSDGHSRVELEAEVAALAGRLAPVRLPGLTIGRLGRFLALVPDGENQALTALAATCVTELDAFRAPATDAELARRRATGLTPLQEVNLVQWGYPYVLDAFRFHITLTGRLPSEAIDGTATVLEQSLAPQLPRPFNLDTLALVGEDDQGRFELIHRYALSG